MLGNILRIHSMAMREHRCLAAYLILGTMLWSIFGSQYAITEYRYLVIYILFMKVMLYFFPIKALQMAAYELMVSMDMAFPDMTVLHFFFP